MNISRNPTTHQVTHDKYEVFHLFPYDKLCDLHLLAHTENDSEQLLIPVHKNVLISSLEYFANMFKETSNFIETNESNLEKSSSENDLKTTATLVPIVKIQVENPQQFGIYLSTFYGKNVHLTDENCLDFYKLADFFTDDDMIEKVSEFINANKLSSANIIKLASFTDKFDTVIGYYIENQILDVDEAYSLSKTFCVSNKFQESLDKYFKDFSDSIKSVKMDKGLERMMVIPKAKKFDCNYDSSSINIVLQNNKAIFRKTGESDWNTGIIVFPSKGIKSYKIKLTQRANSYINYSAILTGWTEHISKQNDWETPGSNNWTKTICHNSYGGSFYHDIKKREYGNAVPKITWSKSDGSDNQTNYIIVKKEDNYNLSWKQGDKINVRDSSSFGFENNKNLFPVIAIYGKGCIVEISDVEISERENKESVK